MVNSSSVNSMMQQLYPLQELHYCFGKDKKKKKKKKGKKCCKSYKDGKRCKDCPLYD